MNWLLSATSSIMRRKREKIKKKSTVWVAAVSLYLVSATCSQLTSASFFPTSTEEEKYFLFWTLVAYNISYTFFFVWTDRRSCKSLVFYIQFIRFPHIPTSPPLTERTMYRSTAADHLTADPFFYPLVSLYFFLVFDSSIPFFHFIPFFSFACTYTMWRSELLPRPGDFNQLGCVRQKWCSSSVLIFHPSNSQFNLSIPTKAKQSTVREPITTWLLFKSTNSIYLFFVIPKEGFPVAFPSECHPEGNVLITFKLIVGLDQEYNKST